MEQTPSAIFYSYSEIWTAITKLCAVPENIKVASAYISDKVQFKWKAGDCLLIALSDTNVRNGSVNPFAVEELVDKGVKVYSNEMLHAKIYCTNEQAIICSCNLSYSSQNDWLEAGVSVTDTHNLDKIASFFKENFKEINLVSKERLAQLKKVFRADVDKPKEQPPAFNLEENVWSVSLIDMEKLPEVLQTRVQSSISETETERNIYSYYHFRTEKNEFRVGDYIIQFKSIGDEMKVFFPARCIKITAITDNLFMVHLRHKGSYQPLKWDDLKSQFLDLDLNPIAWRSKIEQKQKVLERVYHYFNK